MDVSSLQRDDGQTFIPEAANASEGRSGIGASLKISYNRVISDLRAKRVAEDIKTSLSGAHEVSRLLQHFAVGSVREPQPNVLAALKGE